jgi:hypothetical protein
MPRLRGARLRNELWDFSEFLFRERSGDWEEEEGRSASSLDPTGESAGVATEVTAPFTRPGRKVLRNIKQVVLQTTETAEAGLDYPTLVKCFLCGELERASLNMLKGDLRRNLEISVSRYYGKFSAHIVCAQHFIFVYSYPSPGKNPGKVRVHRIGNPTFRDTMARLMPGRRLGL